MECFLLPHQDVKRFRPWTPIEKSLPLPWETKKPHIAGSYLALTTSECAGLGPQGWLNPPHLFRSTAETAPGGPRPPTSWGRFTPQRGAWFLGSKQGSIVFRPYFPVRPRNAVKRSNLPLKKWPRAASQHRGHRSPPSARENLGIMAASLVGQCCPYCGVCRLLRLRKNDPSTHHRPGPSVVSPRGHAGRVRRPDRAVVATI